MADPATIAMAVKTAVAVATDKNTWKAVGSVIAGVLFVLLLPLLIIMSIGSGSAEHNKNISDIVFDGSPVPSDFSPENRQYAEDMQEAFGKLNIAIAETNSDLEAESLDDIRIKAFFIPFISAQTYQVLTMIFMLISLIVLSRTIAEKPSQSRIWQKLRQIYQA